jgi:hypothetical protein
VACLLEEGGAAMSDEVMVLEVLDALRRLDVLVAQRDVARADADQLRNVLQEVVSHVESQGFSNMPWLRDARAALHKGGNANE